MTQMNPGDWPIDPAATDGNVLADKLNRLVNAINAGHNGAGRPPGAAAGMTWSRPVAGGGIEFLLFDGTQDRVLLTVDSAGNVAAANAASATDLANTIQAFTTAIAAINQVPSGLIGKWSGSIASIPAGWALCNGDNGTPDLRDKFIIGAGGAYAVKATGGRAAITEVPAHDHAVGSLATSVAGWHGHGVYDPGHRHQVDQRGGVNAGQTTNEPFEGQNYSGPWSGYAYTGISIAGDGNHSHPIVGRVASAGVASVNILPPYLALAYIMKL